MSAHPIPPFYFPTTVLFVDDNIGFLSNLSLQLASGLSFQLYNSPIDALAILNDSGRPTTPIGRFFSRYHHTDDLPLTHHVIDVNLGKIHREIYNEFRFEQVSVVVVDYDMPSIDGIEFCRGIKNPDIKKILLTGKADEKIAVRAFNEGVIDRFILKQDKDAIETLNQSIVELQQAYFRQTERMLTDALAIGKHAFLRDPLFTARFQEIREHLHIVEFYLCSEPDGILMLNAQGESFLLLVQNENAMFGQYEIAESQGAPQELLDALKRNEVVPYFWQTEGFWTPACSNWHDFVFPSTEFQGLNWYCYAIVNNPPPFRTDLVFFYHDFLDELDQIKWTGA